jgi:hypothetical protein
LEVETQFNKTQLLCLRKDDTNGTKIPIFKTVQPNVYETLKKKKNIKQIIVIGAKWSEVGCLNSCEVCFILQSKNIENHFECFT